MDSLVAKTIEEMDRVDILVKNAGVNIPRDALEFTEEDWDGVLDVNLKGLFFLSQRVAGKDGALILAPTVSPYQPVLTDQVFENYKAMIDTAWTAGRYWGEFEFQSAEVKGMSNSRAHQSNSPPLP